MYPCTGIVVTSTKKIIGYVYRIIIFCLLLVHKLNTIRFNWNKIGMFCFCCSKKFDMPASDNKKPTTHQNLFTNNYLHAYFFRE